jgi:hypothetical protein
VRSSSSNSFLFLAFAASGTVNKQRQYQPCPREAAFQKPHP